MKVNRLVLASAAVAVTLSSSIYGIAADTSTVGSEKIKHVLLLSIDGMHAVDFYNCAHGIAGANGGRSVLPEPGSPGQDGDQLRGCLVVKALGLLSRTDGAGYRWHAETTGIYYDVAFDRTLDGPAITTGTGLAAAPCTPGAAPTGTTTDNDQGIDLDDTKLNGGADAGLTEGGLDRPEKAVPATRRQVARRCTRGTSCAPTPSLAWSMRRADTRRGSTSTRRMPMVAGPGGTGLDDYYAPEVDSNVVALPGVKTSQGASCATVRDATAPRGTPASKTSSAMTRSK
jgi:hypothetical protein